ncbi:MAG: GNAT family N-acetyltransferase [Anaerolineales bacterium]
MTYNIFMIEITPEDVTPDIWSLFDITQPTMPRAFNVLDGIARGTVLVDDPAHPTLAVVHEGSFGTLYFGGHVDQSLLDVLVEQFRQFGDVGIGCWLDDPLNEMLPPEPDYDGFTYYFPQRSQHVKLQPLIQNLPDGLTLAQRDAHLFTKSFDYASTLASFGTLEQVIAQTLGMMILDGETVVCEAATGAPTHGRIEIGVTTAPTHRQRGLASIACASLIVECEARGYSTWWDCAKQNIPSVKLAETLGFENRHEYHYVMWVGS